MLHGFSRRFQFQVLLLTAVLVALAVGSLGLWTWIGLSERVRHELQVRYESATQQLAVALADPLTQGEPDRAEHMLVRSAGDWAEVQDLRILDLSGLPLVHITIPPGKAPKRVYAAPKDPLKLPQNFQAETNRADLNGHEILRFWSPVARGQPVGWVYAEVSTRSLVADRHDMVLTTTAWAVVAGAAATLLMHLIIRRPMRALENARRFALRMPDEPGARLTTLPAPVEFEALQQALDDASARIEAQRRTLSATLSSELRLSQDQRLTEAVAHHKAQFLAHLSHEIRTPLNAVIGLTYLTLQTALQDKQRQHLGKVHQSAQNLLTILNDILDFSKIEAGQVATEFQPFRIDELLQDVADVLSFRAEDKGLEFLMDRGPDVPNVLLGDRLRLQQVLVNLGSHALSVTPTGEVVIRVMAQGHPDGLVTLRFDVMDGGTGVTRDPRLRLRANSELAEDIASGDEGGTGLGLAICQSLVALMGGKMELATGHEKDSPFCFTVPSRLPSPEQMQDLSRGLDEPVDPLKTDLRGRRCLIVDDSATALEISTRMLAQLGLRVDTATSAFDATVLVEVARTSGDPFELVLLDWQMPHVDGLTAAARIAQRCGPTCPKLVLVTAFGAEEARTQARQQGVALDGCLAKPTTLTQLSRLLLALFPEPSAPPPAPDSGESEPAGALSGLRLLVAEDSEVNREVARATLEMHGAEVVLVSDGSKAVNLLNAMAERGDKPFDAVLMDCQMPHMDGYEATRLLRAQERFASLPIIATTAQAMAQEVQAMQAAGMDGYVPKPFVVEDLLESILRQTSGSHPRRP